MAIHTVQTDRKYVRITDHFDHRVERIYGIAISETVLDDPAHSEAEKKIYGKRKYLVIELPNGQNKIYLESICEDITKKQYFHAVLGGNV